MATHEVDQKLLGKLARAFETHAPVVSKAFYTINGISSMLSTRLFRARQIRGLDNSRDPTSSDLYQRIVWLSREGLEMTEQISPDTDQGQLGPEARIFVAKLRASFYHVICLFHNQPPLRQKTAARSHGRSASNLVENTDVSPRRGANSGQRRQTSRDGNNSKGKEASATMRDRQAALRDQIPSMISEASYITNPYASAPQALSPPPGLPTPILLTILDPANFLLPGYDYRAITSSSFVTASKLANALLPGSSPLRVSIQLEYCAFLWDCMEDHETSRKTARRAMKDVYRADAGMDDDTFDDAALLVGTLSRFMKRGDTDESPRFAADTPRDTPPGQRPAVQEILEQDSVSPTATSLSPETYQWSTMVAEASSKPQTETRASSGDQQLNSVGQTGKPVSRARPKASESPKTSPKASPKTSPKTSRAELKVKGSASNDRPAPTSITQAHPVRKSSLPGQAVVPAWSQTVPDIRRPRPGAETRRKPVPPPKDSGSATTARAYAKTSGITKV